MKDELTREQCVRIQIIYDLKCILRSARIANRYIFDRGVGIVGRYSFDRNCLRLEGALDCMYFVGDISDEERKRVLRLVEMIEKKYCKIY